MTIKGTAMTRRAHRYPGEEAAQKARKGSYRPVVDDERDFVPGTGICPNYDKFERLGWSAEKTLAWLNID